MPSITAPWMKKKTVRKTEEPKPIQAATPSNAAQVLIDYPQAKEILRGNHYAVRLSASGGETVEISIDKGDWQPARQAGGYYWFDWCNFEPGAHTLVARMKTPDGKIIRTQPRKVTSEN